MSPAKDCCTGMSMYSHMHMHPPSRQTDAAGGAGVVSSSVCSPPPGVPSCRDVSSSMVFALLCTGDNFPCPLCARAPPYSQRRRERSVHMCTHILRASTYMTVKTHNLACGNRRYCHRRPRNRTSGAQNVSERARQVFSASLPAVFFFVLPPVCVSFYFLLRPSTQMLIPPRDSEWVQLSFAKGVGNCTAALLSSCTACHPFR